MSASGKSTGKGGSPTPGSGKGGGETNPTPGSNQPGMPINYNAANDVYGQGLQVNQPMQGYYNQFPAGGSNYAPPVYPEPPEPPKSYPTPYPGFDYNNPFGNSYSGGGQFGLDSTSPYGFYNNRQSQYQYQPNIQTERPGQGQGSPFDQLLQGVTNSAQTAATAPAAAPAAAPVAAPAAAPVAAPAALVDPRASRSGNGRYSFNHPQYGQIDDLTESGLQAMIAETGPDPTIQNAMDQAMNFRF